MIRCEQSAYKHWFTQPQIDYAFKHAVAMFPLEPRKPGDKIMVFLGYPDEFMERRMEIFVSSRTMSVFHAMECRQEWLHFFNDTH